jgi:energy-coupling factor transporter ATP-binding protein EcfA2
VLRFGPREAKAPVHPLFARELARAVPPPDRRGLTVFFTGLSGSGKSTVAKALAEALEQDGRRRVSLLDGDEIRRLLSAGLGFSRADRDLNIRRIGFVATEVTRHGGLAICAPIAPFAQVRSVRQGPAGPDRRVHRHLLAVRGAHRRRPGDRHRRGERAGRGGPGMVRDRRPRLPGTDLIPGRSTVRTTRAIRVDPSPNAHSKSPTVAARRPSDQSRESRWQTTSPRWKSPSSGS